MSHEHLEVCGRCGRRNWYEDDRCAWCNAKIPGRWSREINKTIDQVIIVVALVSLAGLGWIVVGRWLS